MASRRSKRHGITPGTIRGQDRYWLSESHWQRRYNHALDTANEAIGKTTKCNHCDGEATCYNAAVTKSLGARSWWKCTTCSNEYKREISPEDMLKFYREDAEKTRTSTAQEASA
jgi:hypothetical protein